MERFEYARINCRLDMRDREVYESEDFKSDSLVGILNDMGFHRWELIGEVDGEIIMKRTLL